MEKNERDSLQMTTNSHATIGTLITCPSNSASKFNSNYASLPSLSADSIPIIAPATMVFVAC